MSGVDYSNPLVTKQDVQRVERRIQTNTTLTQIPLASAANVLYYDDTTNAVSYNTAPGGGGGGAPICMSAHQTLPVTLIANTDQLLTFDAVSLSLNGFAAQGSDTFVWQANRTAVFQATFVARCLNSTSLTEVDVAIQIMAGTGPTVSTALANGSGYALVSRNSAPSETTTRANLTIVTGLFTLNSGQMIQIRAISTVTGVVSVTLDAPTVTSGGRTINAPSYSLFVQEVAA